ncbi:MAG: DEAD/DEAH box helicase [Dehalococcoidia bacterium]
MLRTAGIETPTPIQLLAIPDALAGRDVCGKAKTGSGKTLAFGLPMIERTPKAKPGRPRALVLVPTRELATQVARAIQPAAAVRELRVAAIYGGVSLNPQAQLLRRGIDILIATPGRLNDLLERGALTVAEVGCVVIDEADQMADFGFLPQVERILDQVEGDHQTLLFSATLDGAVARLIARYQHDPVHHDVVEQDQGDSPMLHRFIGVDVGRKLDTAVAIASGPERTLFFVRTQRAADRLAIQLSRAGLPVGCIHGRLSQGQRERALHEFSTGVARILVATNIAARGIHVDGIDIVCHYDIPEDVKTYMHRSGRTARAGATGIVVTLVEASEAKDIHSIRREAGVREAIVPIEPDDPRLADLAGWEPPLEAADAIGRIRTSTRGRARGAHAPTGAWPQPVAAAPQRRHASGWQIGRPR